MKIVAVTGPFLPDIGGVQNYIQQIGSRLVDRGHEVTVFAHRTSPDLADEDCFSGVNVRRFDIRFARSHQYSVPMQRAVAKAAAHADVVHVHNLITYYAFRSASITSAPVVINPHYHGMPGREGALAGRYRYPLSYAYKRFSSIIFSSSAERARVVADLGPLPCPTTVISPAVHPDIATWPARPNPRPFVLSVGRLVPHKRVDLLVRAVGLAAPLELVIIGSGPERGTLEALIDELQLRDRVRFETADSDEDLWAWMRAATVVASLSTEEAFGMVLAEGVAAGCLIVATDLAAHAEAAASCPDHDVGWVGIGAAPQEVAKVLTGAMHRGRFDGGRSVPTWNDACDATEQWYADIVKQFESRLRS